MRWMSEALTGPESKAVAVHSESESPSSDILNHTPVSLSPPSGGKWPHSPISPAMCHPNNARQEKFCI